MPQREDAEGAMMLLIDKHPADTGPLILAIRAQQREYPDSQLGVGTGWAGPKCLDKHPAFEPFAPALHAACRKLVGGCEIRDLSAWGNVLDVGQKIDWHAHERSHLGGRNRLAGVLYLTAGSTFRCDIEGLTIRPQPGLFLVFDAWCRHSVDPATEERISVAFNVRAGAP